MSSYMTSPFVLEERRLQGIVQQCSRDLENALRAVEMQQQLMEARNQAQKEDDENYHEEMDQASHRLTVSKRMNQEKRMQKKAHLESILEDMKLEMEVFSRYCGVLEISKKRQEKLEKMLRQSDVDYENIEKKIQEHIHATEEEMLSKTSSEQFIMVKSKVRITKTRIGQKGISLKENKAESTKSSAKKRPVDIFIEKMEFALKSQSVQKIPGIKELKRDFDAEPEYSKTAFAIRNLDKLEEYIKRISKIEKQEKAAADQWEKTVLKYKAICRLLKVDPAEELVTTRSSFSRLQQVLKEYAEKYQEGKQREYIIHSVKTVLEKHGIMFQDADGEEGILFSMEDAQVHVVNTGTDLLSMEVIGAYSGDTPTKNEKRKSVATAERFCKLLPDIEEELRVDFGILFSKVSTQPPNEEQIAMQRTGRSSGKKTHESKKAMSL